MKKIMRTIQRWLYEKKAFVRLDCFNDAHAANVLINMYRNGEIGARQLYAMATYLTSEEYLKSVG